MMPEGQPINNVLLYNYITISYLCSSLSDVFLQSLLNIGNCEYNQKPRYFLCNVRMGNVVLVYFLLNVFGVGVSCRILYYFVIYLYVKG